MKASIPGWAACSLAVVALAAGVVAGWAAPAAAHAVLVETEPADGADLTEAPRQVVLVFSEPVTAPVAGLRVFDSEGGRVDTGDTGRGSQPSQLQVGLEQSLGSGTYIVTWRAISADSHPVRGAFVFQIGEGAEADESLMASLLAGDSDLPWAAANAVSRWMGYASALLVAGGMLFLTFVERQPPRAELRRVLGWAAWVGIAATVGVVVFQGAETTGLGAAALVDPSVIGQTLGSSVGVSAMVRAGAFAAFLILLWAGLVSPPWPGLAVGAVAAGSFLLTGHTVTSDPRAVTVMSDTVHLFAAAAWFGGLVVLAVTLRQRRREDDPAGAARLVGRFSTLATISVLVLAAGGLGLAWVEVRAPRALPTPYGWTLIAKTGLVVALLGIGAYNNRRLVPALTAPHSPGPGTLRTGSLTRRDRPAALTPAEAWSRLRRTVRWEIGGLVAVVLVTAVLVNLQPAREAAGVTGVFSTHGQIGDGYHVNLVVDPNRAGTNQIHLYLLTETGRPADLAEDVTFELSKPDADIGPLTRTPEVAGPGHWILTGPELAIPGEWVVAIRLQTSEFEESRTEIPVHVNP